jgi:hypothetical protein
VTFADRFANPPSALIVCRASGRSFASETESAHRHRYVDPRGHPAGSSAPESQTGALSSNWNNILTKLAELILAAARKGQWRAVAFLYDRVYGTPKETVEATTVTVPASVHGIAP